MFSQNNAYYYEQPELQLFQRELPYKSIKLPITKREQNQMILSRVQRKHEVEQLRLQILDRCKLEELEYLEILKKQRETMEEDIQRRKKEIEIRNMENKIAINKMQNRNDTDRLKPKDSLDQLQNEQEIHRNRAKTQRAQSAYSSQMSSFGGTGIPSIKNKEPSIQANKEISPIIVSQQVEKDKQIKKIKQEMLNKYKFVGEAGKKLLKKLEYERSTEIDWWVDKVKKYKQEEAKSEQKRKENQTVYSDTNSEKSNS